MLKRKKKHRSQALLNLMWLTNKNPHLLWQIVVDAVAPARLWLVAFGFLASWHWGFLAFTVLCHCHGNRFLQSSLQERLAVVFEPGCT